MEEILPFGKLSSRKENELTCGAKITGWIYSTVISVLGAVFIGFWTCHNEIRVYTSAFLIGYCYYTIVFRYVDLRCKN